MKYIKLNPDKSPAMKFENFYNSYNDLENVGVMLNDNIVLIDFDGDNDNEIKYIEHIKIHYPTLFLKTNRGYHFYYKIPYGINIKNGADKITAGGFQVDYKTGNNSYGIIKLNGKIREANKEINFESLEYLPEILYPHSKSKTNLSNLSNGDGRNNLLFAHLRSLNTLYDNIKLFEIGYFINNVTFSETLPEKEINSLINSVETYKEADTNYKGDTKDMISFSKFIVQKMKVKNYNNKLYYLYEDKFINNECLLLREINKYLELKSSQDTEVINQLKKHAEYILVKTQDFKINLNNKAIKKGEIVEQDMDFTPFYLNINYDPNAYNKDVDDFLNFVSSDDMHLRYVLEEILGHCLLLKNFPHKMFFLIGSGKNGKSTLVEMISSWIGNLSSHIDITNFDEGTSVLTLVEKLVNISDDVDPVYLEKSKNLKTMASGNSVSARAIYSLPLEFRNTATLIFTANEPPTFKDKSNGIFRRLVIIPFENTVKNCNPYIEDLLTTDNAKSYLLNLALNSIKRIQNNKMELTKCNKIEKVTNQYHIENDTVLLFIQEFGLSNMLEKTFNYVYNMYVDFTTTNRQKAVSKQKFGRTLREKGLESKNITKNGITNKFIVYNEEKLITLQGIMNNHEN